MYTDTGMRGEAGRWKRHLLPRCKQKLSIHGHIHILLAYVAERPCVPLHYDKAKPAVFMQRTALQSLLNQHYSQSRSSEQ